MPPAISSICGVAARACFAMCLLLGSSQQNCGCLLRWSLQITSLDASLLLACVAGGIVSAREIKFWTSEQQSRKENGENGERVPLPILLAASPLACPKLYFAGAYNTASYAGYTALVTILAVCFLNLALWIAALVAYFANSAPSPSHPY